MVYPSAQVPLSILGCVTAGVCVAHMGRVRGVKLARDVVSLSGVKFKASTRIEWAVGQQGNLGKYRKSPSISEG